MFHIKICGFTRLDDLISAFEFGADAAGFNFFKGSKRYIKPEPCRQIISAAPGEMEFVGVFVNENPQTINSIADNVGLDWVQLSGDEDEEDILSIEKRTIKVIRPESVKDLATAETCPADMIMFDASEPGLYGGTGRTVNVEFFNSNVMKRPFILAGGLDVHNVGSLIRLLNPCAVDVATGVEKSPGKKDLGTMEQFIRIGLEALNG